MKTNPKFNLLTKKTTPVLAFYLIVGIVLFLSSFYLTSMLISPGSRSDAIIHGVIAIIAFAGITVILKIYRR